MCDDDHGQPPDARPDVPLSEQTCAWDATFSEGDVYETACGWSFCFDFGTPRERGMLFCAHCGRRIEDVTQ